MNEADRAAFADAEQELMDLNLAEGVLDEVEELWVGGLKAAAAEKLAFASGKLTIPQARSLLRRNYL